MTSRRSFGLGLTGTAVNSLLKADATRPPRQQPNIVVFLADDLGYGDLGCFGNRAFQTPFIDRMASEGVQLTEFYAMPTCTPAQQAC